MSKMNPTTSLPYWTKTKTITVAERGDETRYILPSGKWWPLPPLRGQGQGHQSGTWAYKDTLRQWHEEGWTTKRVPNPNYKPRASKSFISFFGID